VSAAVVRVAGERACGGREVSAVVDDASRVLFIPRTEERAPICRARGCFITRGEKNLARAVFSSMKGR
jgi:hypothetical protein